MALTLSETRFQPIAAPEPHLTSDELIRRARAMRPWLRERQIDCETGGNIPQDVNAELIRCGFYRTIQPRRFGGYEFDVATFYKVMMEIARGCAETGWVLTLTAGHPLVAALFPEEGQRELYGTSGDFRCPAAFLPPGKAIAADGGYRVSGKWPSASGIDLSTHLVSMATIAGSDPKLNGKLRAILIMLTRDEFSIVDDWHVMGMQGTGSKSVIANDVFVPARRTAPTAGLGRVADVVLRGPPIYDNPMYAGRIGAFLIGEAAAVAVGAARGALDLYEDLLRSKTSPLPPHLPRHQDPEFQRHYGQALALIATAESALIRAGEEYMEYARMDVAGGDPFDNERDQRLTLIEQQCIRLAWEAVELIYRTAGTSASAKEGQPIGRVFRNLAVINTHPGLQIDRTAMEAARTRFGLQERSAPQGAKTT